MNTVPLSAIEDSWNELYNTTEERAQEIMESFLKEQPELVLYLTEAEQEIDKLDDRGFLTLYGAWIWLAFKLNGRDSTMVTATAVEAASHRNHNDMMRLGETKSSLIMDASREFSAPFRQKAMLGAIVNDILEGQMESESRQDDVTGMLVLCAKTVIDCLDA